MEIHIGIVDRDDWSGLVVGGLYETLSIGSLAVVQVEFGG